LITAGVALGLVTATASSRFLGSLLYGVNPVEGPLYAAVAAAVMAIGLVACDLPARRASRIDPVETLRQE
jgi:ABC-type lipoprotein release transport system permease subunit